VICRPQPVLRPDSGSPTRSGWQPDRSFGLARADHPFLGSQPMRGAAGLRASAGRCSGGDAGGVAVQAGAGRWSHGGVGPRTRIPGWHPACSTPVSRVGGAVVLSVLAVAAAARYDQFRS